MAAYLLLRWLAVRGVVLLCEAVSWAEAPMLIGPAGETTVETLGPFGLTVSGSAAQPLLTGPGLLLSPEEDRKSGVEGKSGDFGGGRIVKKKGIDRWWGAGKP